MSIARNAQTKNNGTASCSEDRAVPSSVKINAFGCVSNHKQSVAYPLGTSPSSTQRYASPAPSDVSGDHANAHGGSTAVSLPVYTGIEKRNPALAEYRRFVETRIKPLRKVTADYPEALWTARRDAFKTLIQERTY